MINCASSTVPYGRSVFALCCLVFALAAPVAGQHTGPGEGFLLTDVTGPAITTGDQVAPLFAEPGPIRTMNCPVAWGVRTATDAMFAQMGAGELRPVTVGYQPGLDAVTQRNVLALLTAASGDRAAANSVRSALTPDHNRRAARAARRLVAESQGLFTTLQRLDPLRPGAVAPTRLSRAVGAYNAFIDASSPEFLAQPPEELSALHAVFNSLVIASLEHDGRVADPRVVDARGLACALLVEEVVVPPPVVERAIQICVLIDRDFQIVTGLIRPESGDTMVLVDGVRRPFAQVYPEAGRVPQPEWLMVGAPVTIGGVRYTQFGVQRTVQPGELTIGGQIEGVDYYVMPGRREAVLMVVYLPIAPDCVVQPYQRAETIRVRG